MTFIQAIIIALIQGFTELFPISSLGHSVLIADLFGWDSILRAQTVKGSYYLTFLVALHVATALALFIFYRRVWHRIAIGFCTSIRKHEVRTVYQKMAWLLVIGTIPAAILGVLFESFFRSLFEKPVIAAGFLIINGCILFFGDYLHRRQQRATTESLQASNKQTAQKLTYTHSTLIGVAQSLALIAGISRSGITMVSGLSLGLTYESAARFSFLLATPVIFLAGVYKVPELMKSSAHSILPETLVGAVVAGIAAYLSVRFLDKYFQSKRLYPFAIYCCLFGGFMIIFQFFK